MFKSGLSFLLLGTFVFILSCKSSEVEPKTEREQIKTYIKDSVLIKNKVLRAIVDSDSVLYVFFTKINPNKADTLSKGKDVTINSVGKFLNGKTSIFDNYPLTFVLGSGRVLTGLDAGVSQMKRGEKAIIIFTSLIGYGATKPYGTVNAKGRVVVKDSMGKVVIDTTTKLPKFTYVDIPADTPLAFEIEVVK